MRANPVGDLVSAIERATVLRTDVFAEDARLDATVPNWRFPLQGAGAIRQKLAEWYRHTGRFEELRRTPLPHGELVEYTLSWEENGVPHACHQVHVFEVSDGRITVDKVWCGGRWPASRLAEMEESAREAGIDARG